MGGIESRRRRRSAHSGAWSSPRCSAGGAGWRLLLIAADPRFGRVGPLAGARALVLVPTLTGAPALTSEPGGVGSVPEHVGPGDVQTGETAVGHAVVDAGDGPVLEGPAGGGLEGGTRPAPGPAPPRRPTGVRGLAVGVPRALPGQLPARVEAPGLPATRARVYGEPPLETGAG